MDRNMNSQPFLLNGAQRAVVESAIPEVCAVRGYGLIAINVRTNHVHIVVSAVVSPNAVINAVKANATRELREAGLVDAGRPIWSRGGSTKYLWKPRNVETAVEYTINGQGSDLPNC